MNYGLVNSIEVSENKEALIVLAATLTGATTTLIAALPIPTDIKIPSNILVNLGFDLKLIGNTLYVQTKLEALKEDQIEKIKEAFIANKHPRFKKEAAPSRHEPFGKTSNYITSIKTADKKNSQTN